MWDQSRDNITPRAKGVLSEKGVYSPSPLTWPFTKKSDGTQKLLTTGSVDGCSVLPETQLVGIRLRMDTTWVLYVGVFPSPMGAFIEMPEF